MARVSDRCELTSSLTPTKWRRWLREGSEAQDEMLARLRQCTHTGRPAGGARFIARLEALVGRVLRAKKVGRPRKHKPAGSKTGKEQQDDDK